jgi:hypothetical protein
LIDSFLETITNKEKTQPLTNANNSIESHLMAFAAEQSRLKANVVKMDEFRTKFVKSKNTNS